MDSNDKERVAEAKEELTKMVSTIYFSDVSVIEEFKESYTFIGLIWTMCLSCFIIWPDTGSAHNYSYYAFIFL